MNRELFLALETGDLTEIQRLHWQDPQVLLGVTFQGDTPLHIAAREGHMSIVDWILQLKPSLAGAPNKDGNTPLHEVAKCGNPELIRILLRHRRFSVYRSNKFGETALIIASRYGRLESVHRLLGAFPYTDAWQMSKSFREAAYGRHPGIARAILNQPIIPRPFSRRLHALVEWDTYEDVAKATINNLSKPFKLWGPKIFTVRSNLLEAVHGGHPEVVYAVLDSPAWKYYVMTAKDEYGRSAIHVAAMKGHWDIINVFMSRWPYCVESRSSDHKSVVHFAVEYNQFQIVQILLLTRSPLRVAELVSRDHDCFYNTVLHLAATNGVNPQLVEYLVSRLGVNVNALNNDNLTALDIASAASHHNPNCAIIKQKLEDAGGIRFSVMPKSNTTSVPSDANDSNEGGDRDIVNTQIVVASLIATVTFAAIFQIPGGIEDDEKSIHYGAAKMVFHKLFKIFIFSDIAAFITSFTVVVAWLIRQLLGDTSLTRTLALSHVSVVTLIVSIWWTTAAFLSATIIITVPSNYKNLKSTHKKDFYKYKSLLTRELDVAIISAFYVGMPLLIFLYNLFKRQRTVEFSKLAVCFPLFMVTLVILIFTFARERFLVGETHVI
ncbi:ankyrin repeat-containing protein ITN1-like [Cryptomeria japonica]|uniref:ankyrin repeat-containing protein ITN1-like n=1 Tax=Cryptomeria japonica TaxID=3369 RepID=UPI0027DA9098|nr:ankyrin repeat-containing protein ITN1-like [Cryptomeria japonica]